MKPHGNTEKEGFVSGKKKIPDALYKMNLPV